ncbi:MAG: twin-arginine translocation signal domain-containing protein [Desulfarculaceae bacterium]|nr:twin-arginine translocation signal domain-containing protein [Desulfarculaceae bacterium]MCF8071543.1 twin-arginine translocation signal domain-containing protein [Desulfarculaceae bacterium]MCF8102358.1 twin-arginine translocation signal domain-containing protein [Desulfarculaceae bacterium]MCF8114822.1 twin-arginine translocation signal domain-containing protein [Desulfarculaceae bacterium]
MPKFTRRQFLGASGALAGGLALSSLGIPLGALQAHARDLSKAGRIKTARTTISTCYYCSVSCGLLCSTDQKTGQIINIEGDPDHPISEGSLCAKGAAMFQMSDHNQHRLAKVLYRRPFGTEWEVKDWDWAVEKMARNIKSVRDQDFMYKNAQGQVVNRLETIGHMGSSKVDNEECWLITTMARALGLVHIDHQARV